jgi:hypothetical protein
MAEFILSPETLRHLTAKGISYVGDFILQGRAELIAMGVPPKAIDETRETLLYHGIRTIDNPPERK